MPQVKYTTAKGLHQVSGKGVVGMRATVEVLTDAGAGGANRTALTADESGKIFLVPALTGGTQTIALPEATADTIGCKYTFILTATAGQDFNVTGTAGNKIVGAVPKGDGDNNAISSGHDSIGFDENAVIGSRFTVTCVSTTDAIAYHLSEVFDGLAANTGGLNLA